MPTFPFEKPIPENDLKVKEDFPNNSNEDCPYCCANDAKLVMHGRSFRIFAVKCLNCECLGPVGDNEKQALDKWNYRGAQGFIRGFHKKPWD